MRVSPSFMASSGIGLLRRGRSASVSAGMVASASGGSGVSCMRLSARASSAIAARSAAVIDARARASRSALLLRLALGLLRIRPQDQRGAVAVADEMAADQVLEIAPGGDPRLDRGERRLEGERRQRIAIVQPGLQCAQTSTRCRAGTSRCCSRAGGTRRCSARPRRSPDRCRRRRAADRGQSISRSTLSASVGSMPLRPIENAGWRRTSASPAPVRPSPARSRSAPCAAARPVCRAGSAPGP